MRHFVFIFGKHVPGASIEIGIHCWVKSCTKNVGRTLIEEAFNVTVVSIVRSTYVGTGGSQNSATPGCILLECAK